MYLNVDTKRIVKARVVPFEEDEGVYGIDWDLDRGQSGSQRIGTREEAEAALKKLHGGRSSVVVPFPK